MAADSPFLVPVRELPATRELRLDAPFVGAAVAGLPMREALEVAPDDPSSGGGDAELSLYGEGEHVFATGRIRGTVRVACSRCVEPVDLAFDEPIRVTFLPAAEMPSDDEAPEAKDEDGAEVGEGDLDLFPYDGETVDLEPLLREHFVLAVPFSPLCREDCAGLCPQCGANRNTAPCACEKPADPRFAGLRGLKLPS